jgi:hypothetical protein
MFWLGCKLQPDIALETHTIRFAFTIEDRIDPAHFRRAIAVTTDRFDALRTTIREHRMVPMRQVSDQPVFTLEQLRFSDQPDPDAALRRWLDDVRESSLPADAPVRSVLVELGPRRSVWYLALHHLIADARAISMIVSHVARSYQCSLDGAPDDPAGLPPSFEEYAAYERLYRSSDAYAKAASYWATKLSKISGIARSDAAAPQASQESPHHRLRTEQVAIELSAAQTTAIHDVANREGLYSPAVVFLTALFVTAARMRRAGGPLAIGAPFLNRPERFLDTVGLLVSTCPLLVTVDPGESVQALARRVQAEMIRTSANQGYVVQNRAHARAYDVFFNYLNVQFADFAGRRVRAERIRSGYSNNAMSLTVQDFNASGRFTLELDFQRERIAPGRRRDAMACLQRTIDAFVEDSQWTISGFLEE